ncbi:DUF2092 domain-containing protein [Natronolimnohabitans sp. A-GB9]|uniref:LolA family protein n=1 Tax=Natronolimnohabitans sp. A-GB9 TaxID=3069757 RepID=UPI0027B7E8B1|nr:DUF2092 domain-containing protein [Natronolimnohabitans sp. A-GB9]MDQ2052780.1 DUF2092 domain-containing protein [Natronolimnohabitans sp. A-GB9]
MTARRTLVAVAVFAVVVLGGCVAVSPPADDPDPETLFEAGFVHGDDLEAVSGEVTTEVIDGDRTISETVRVVERPYVDYRETVLETDDPYRQAGDVYVSNASVSWWYSPDSQWATYYEPDDSYENEAVRSDRADRAAELREWYDLDYQGTETIADRETYVLEVEARDEAVEEGLSVLVGDTEFVYALETVDREDDLDVLERIVWIDAEYEYPIKERLVYEGPDGDRYEMTERFESVSFEEDVDDETFAFEPPENVTVESS